MALTADSAVTLPGGTLTDLYRKGSLRTAKVMVVKNEKML